MSLDDYEPPIRHYLFCLGAFQFYWIWSNEGSEKHQHRGYVASWCTKRSIIHLMDWRWWVPLRQFPRALIGNWRVAHRKS